MFKLVVLSVVLVAAAATPSGLWGAGWGAPLAAGWGAWGHGVAPLAVPPVAPVGAYNYRGPLSPAPGQPANILAADGRPLDTLSVNLDRAVHNTARALELSGRRLKRSILVAPLAGAGLATDLLAAPLVSAQITQGRSLVGPARLAQVALPVAGPLGVGIGAGLGIGNVW